MRWMWMMEIDFCNIMAYNHKHLCMWVFLMESSILYIRSSQIGNIRPKRHINRFKNPTAQSELIFDNMHTKSQWKLCVPHHHEVRLCILWNPSLSFSTHVYKLAVSHKHRQVTMMNIGGNFGFSRLYSCAVLHHDHHQASVTFSSWLLAPQLSHCASLPVFVCSTYQWFKETFDCRVFKYSGTSWITDTVTRFIHTKASSSVQAIDERPRLTISTIILLLPVWRRKGLETHLTIFL